MKLVTPGYPLWVVNNTRSAPDFSDEYYPLNEPTAVLLNFTLSADSKTLLLNHWTILPVADTLAPPQLSAYQIPADFTQEAIEYWDLLGGKYFCRSIAPRHLSIDYDRLVWADSTTGPYFNHITKLHFRIMGLGTRGRDDSFDDRLQKVVHITLADQKHGPSDESDRSYLITDVQIKESRKS